MKTFKNILIIIALSTPTIIFPKIVTGTQKPTPQPTPTYVQPPQIKTPTAGAGAPQIPSKKTFAQLVTEVKNDRTAWDNTTKKLNTSFIFTITEAVITSELEDYQFDLLLQMARDYHAQFTGNEQTDINILNGLTQQRNELIRQYKLIRK